MNQKLSENSMRRTELKYCRSNRGRHFLDPVVLSKFHSPQREDEHSCTRSWQILWTIETQGIFLEREIGVHKFKVTCQWKYELPMSTQSRGIQCTQVIIVQCENCKKFENYFLFCCHKIKTDSEYTKCSVLNLQIVSLLLYVRQVCLNETKGKWEHKVPQTEVLCENQAVQHLVPRWESRVIGRPYSAGNCKFWKK